MGKLVEDDVWILEVSVESMAALPVGGVEGIWLNAG